MEKRELLAKGQHDVPPHIAPYLKTLELRINHENQLKEAIFNMYDSQSNPLSFGLDLAFYIRNFKKSRLGRLPILILELLKEWCTAKNISQLLTKRQKIHALDLGLQFPNANVIKLICDIFKLNTEMEFVKQTIHRLLHSRRYKEVFYIISAMDMENELPLENCAFPLFFLGHESWVKSYLGKCPQSLQLQFVNVVDALCSDNLTIQDFVRSLELDEFKPLTTKIDTKWIKKRLPVLVDFLNIDIRKCPNLYYSRASGAMNYLYRKLFVEESIEYHAWEEMMADTIADHPDLQKELLIRLICRDDAPIAFRFIDIFKMSRNNWPEIMLTMPFPADNSVTTGFSSGLTNTQDYLQFRLSRTDIKLIDTPDKLRAAVDDISENYNVVGMDAEWKPNLGIFKEKSSLCQLAVWDTIYLIDILVLNTYSMSDMWVYMLKKIFFNEEILKLGYGVENDLKVVMKTIECEKLVDGCKYPQLVDFGTFFQKLKTHYPEIMKEILDWHPVSSDDSSDLKGLSQHCRITLGKPLDKGEQFSNWERRPFRESQIIYAGLDAYCLLMIYEKIYPLLKNLDLDLDKVIHTTRTPFKPNKTKEVEHKSTLISDFKVVVDNTVGGVTKCLRLLGANVIGLEPSDDHMHAVQIAQSDKRVIITSSGPYKKIIGYMPEDMCYCVDPALNSKMQVVRILKHFKVECSDSDIFTRCTEIEEMDPEDKDLIEESPSSKPEGLFNVKNSVRLSIDPKDIKHVDEDDSSEDDLDNLVYWN